jgi:hypothetical protein
MRAIAYALCHFGETVAIAKLQKALQAELRRRAEYAMRFQVHSPSQWPALRVPIGVVIGLALTAICFLCR